MRPGAGKTALILDLAGISHELGLPDDVREWSLEDGEVNEAKKSRPSPRDCKQCHTVFWGRTCPQCAYYEPMAEVAQVETELEVAVAGVSAPKRKGGRLTRVQLNAELAKVHRLQVQEQNRASGKAWLPQLALIELCGKAWLQAQLGEHHCIHCMLLSAKFGEIRLDRIA